MLRKGHATSPTAEVPLAKPARLGARTLRSTRASRRSTAFQSQCADSFGRPSVAFSKRKRRLDSTRPPNRR
jgi:hypothetical protein